MELFASPLTPGRPIKKGRELGNGSFTPPRSQNRPKFDTFGTPPAKANDRTPFFSRSNTSDRFIPNRADMDFDNCNHLLSKLIDENRTNTDHQTAKRSKYTNSLMSQASQGAGHRVQRRLIDCFDSKRLRQPLIDAQVFSKTFHYLDVSGHGSASPKRAQRIIPNGPSRILDAPDLMDDYYLNLLSWGSSNTIAVALHQSVYLWNAADGRVDELTTLDGPDDYITSVQWSQKDNTLAVGTSGNVVQLWDAARSVKLRELSGHTARVSALSWNGAHVVSSGGRDSTIFNHDVRQSRHIVSTYIAHQQEVCGLAWSPDGSTLASGGNENMLCFFDAAISGAHQSRGATTGNTPNTSSSYMPGASRHAPRVVIRDHTAAVKALAWCPWQRHTLASGGGTADRTLRVWNTADGSNVKCVDTGSQVCAIQWSDSYKELVSSHGFSDNQLILWKYPTMSKIREFRGHTSRVLHLAKSPDGSTLCSASADETMRFWDIFSPSSTSTSSSTSSSTSGSSGGGGTPGIVGRGARDSGCNTLSVGTPTFTPSSGAAGGGGRKRDFDGTPLRCQGLSLR